MKLKHEFSVDRSRSRNKGLNNILDFLTWIKNSPTSMKNQLNEKFPHIDGTLHLALGVTSTHTTCSGRSPNYLGFLMSLISNRKLQPCFCHIYYGLHESHKHMPWEYGVQRKQNICIFAFPCVWFGFIQFCRNIWLEGNIREADMREKCSFF